MQVNKIKGRYVEKGFTQTSFAAEMGMTPKTLRYKLSKGILDSNEINRACVLLELDPNSQRPEDHPAQYFFENWVTQKVTKESA